MIRTGWLMETISTGTAPSPPEEHSRARRWLWLVVRVVLALLAGVVIWVVVIDGSSNSVPPTATFDGDEGSYSGPSTIVVDGDWLWTATFVNDTSHEIYWSLAMLADDHPSLGEHHSWMEDWREDEQQRPPYIIYLEEGRLHAGQTVEVEVGMKGTVALGFLVPYAGEWYSAGFVEVETATD